MNLKKPLGRSLEDFKPLMSAERRLLDACSKGEGMNLASEVPETATEENRVRAEFLRFLLLGGDEQSPVHEAGLHLQGAFVEGFFDLSGCHIAVGMSFMRCRFDDEIDANHAHLDGVLSLQGCYLAKGFEARQLRSSASLLLSNGFHALGQVALRGSRIAGDLDCNGGRFEVDTANQAQALAADGIHVTGFVFLNKGFEAVGGVGLVGAKIGGSLYCDGGQFDAKQGQALAIGGAQVKGHVFLNAGFKATGEVGLEGAMIGVDLNCVDGLFDGKHDEALVATGIDVNGSVLLCGGFKATAVVSLIGARIRGSLLCIEGQFEVEHGEALLASGVDVKGSVALGDGFKATGAVDFAWAKIGGDLNCDGGQFLVSQDDALTASGADVKGSVSLGDGFKATGRVKLKGAQIRGDLACNGGQFEVEQGEALLADRLNIQGSIFLRNGFKATGVVRLINAQIGGELACSGGKFEVRKGSALWIDGAEIGSDLKLDNDFRATGEVRLVSAQIGCNLDCSGGKFEGIESDALIADRVSIKGEVFLTDGFMAKGKVRLVGAQIGGNLYCLGGQLDAQGDVALSLESAFVRGSWRLEDALESIRINALDANVGVLSDDLAAWAPGSVLNGLRYASLGGRTTSGADRLEWLRRQSEAHLGETDGGAYFCPQPWRQLQCVLREMGHTEEAKQVGIALQDQLRAIGHMGQWPNDICDVPRCFKGMVSRSTHYVFGKLAGYGYRTIDLVLWMLSVWLVCGAAYWWLALPPQSAIAPSEPLVFQDPRYQQCQPDQLDDAGNPGNWYLCPDLRSEYSTFSPFAFSLDLLLPVVDLGQEKAWGAFIPTPKENPWEEWFSRTGWHWGHAVRFLTWFQTLFGWLCSLLLVAIVSGYSRRNDEG